MKKTCSLLMMLAAGITVFAQHPLHGKITEKNTGQSIANATVVLSGNLNTISDDNGNFYFRGLKKGSYTLTISSIGFKTI
ncbi:MAG TPA: DUF2012 domain-containing protein, partial [Niabella sp.]|nr:DUF2012 domain-containing protein [Niabella sp.]